MNENQQGTITSEWIDYNSLNTNNDNNPLIPIVDTDLIEENERLRKKIRKLKKKNKKLKRRLELYGL